MGTEGLHADPSESSSWQNLHKFDTNAPHFQTSDANGIDKVRLHRFPELQNSCIMVHHDMQSEFHVSGKRELQIIICSHKLTTKQRKFLCVSADLKARQF